MTRALTFVALFMLLVGCTISQASVPRGIDELAEGLALLAVVSGVSLLTWLKGRP